MEEATHIITGVYFPGLGEVELTWEDLLTGEKAFLTTTVTPEEGIQIAKAIPPCVYSGATVQDRLPKYVALGDKEGTALVLDGARYYRPAGQWYVGFKFIKGQLYTVSDRRHLDRVPLARIDEERFKEDNKGYV